MLDQADQLRQLAAISPRTVRDGGDAPPIVAVSGARAGVGVSTIVANLGAVLANEGLRTVLVDATGDVAGLADLAGVSMNQRRLSLLRSTPSGAWLLARPGGDEATGGNARQLDRQLMDDLHRIRADADVVVVDTGGELNAAMRRVWRIARLVLVVTTPDDAAVMACYAKLKLTSEEPADDVRVLVNLCDRVAVAERVVERISHASERFLGRAVKAAPALPVNMPVAARKRAAPRVWMDPENAFTHAALWLGRSVFDALATQATDYSLGRVAC